MGEIIEHSDNGNPPSLRVGESQSRISIKTYQDVYHQITGQTEQLRQRYSDNLLIEFSELEQLHFKVMQLCDVYNVVAHNEVVSVFHDQERKEQFTSFANFRRYNSSSASPSVNVVLKYNFSIVPTGLDKAQEYIVTIRLTSRVAVLKKIEEEAPPFARGRILGYYRGDTAEITVEFADYVVARGFLEAFDEWVRGCKSTPDAAWVDFLKRWSHLVPRTASTVAALVTILFALRTVPDFFGAQSAPEIWARFLIIFSGGFYLIITLAGTAGRLVERSIDSFSTISYLKINKGDEKLIEEFGKRNRRVLVKFLLGCTLTVVLSIASSKLAVLI